MLKMFKEDYEKNGVKAVIGWVTGAILGGITGHVLALIVLR